MRQSHDAGRAGWKMMGVRAGVALLACAMLGPASAEITQHDLGGSHGSHQRAVPVPIPVPIPDITGRGQAPADPVTTSGNSCTCQVTATSGSACMIFLRTNAADWIAGHAPQTPLRSSAGGRFYDAPFPLAASACAGRKVAPAGVKVHWLDRSNAILEWK